MPSHLIQSADGGKSIRIWTPPESVEQEALAQLGRVAALPWVFHHVAVMADVHAGKGCTVGSVIAMKDALSPATVGVDIGCGMTAIRTSLTASDLPDNLDSLRSSIEQAIPVGFNSHTERAYKFGPSDIQFRGSTLFSSFRGIHADVGHLLSKAEKQIGTLGGGNHFIEMCLDEGAECSCVDYFGVAKDVCPYCRGEGKIESRVWLMLHSGSRNIGKELAERHIGIAQKLAHNTGLPDPDLAVFLAGTAEMGAYRDDLMWAQAYAKLNRDVMMELYKGVILGLCGDFNPQFDVQFDEPISCHHNYVSEEIHFGESVYVTRKGAINAGQGQLGIIPGSMGRKSYVVRGRGNPDSFNSASHGAGRRMSRSKARKTFTLADFETQTAGVCCRKEEGFIDEIPGAYKNIDEVMANQAELVEIVATLKQVLCVKG